MRDLNVIIVGVGGQGILLTSRILGALAIDEQKDIKVSEVHGMSQRGGSVITHVRIADKVYAPLVTEGEADFVLSFERLESLRAENYLKKDGVLIENVQVIDPMPVIIGAAQYPTNPPSAKNVKSIDALHLAREAGDQRSVNIVLLGVLSNYIDATEAQWANALEKCIKPKFLSINQKAFALGKMEE